MMIATLAFMTVGACAVDISAETNRHVVIAEGTEKQYNGHPTMTWTDAPDHLICVWTDGHAGQITPKVPNRVSVPRLRPAGKAL